ncbi:MAG: hydroxymethylbilane synthase [Armatimonadetes bacterium]|nr:hydroxymethylbilane synthase [Armatimonadota bacterium]
MKELIVGSRGSQLALTQTNVVINDLQALHPDVSCRVQVIKTRGDKILDVPLAKIGDKGLFVKEIEEALIAGEVEFAIHSAKDLPSEMPEELFVAAFPCRVNPSDVLVSRKGRLSELPAGAVIGTSSLRRKAQILRSRPDFVIKDLRGNLDTRLRKLEEGLYDAVILAYAGMLRLGLQDKITEILSFEICLPAAAQGALAIQCRKDSPVAELIASLDDPATRACVAAERAMLFKLGAGCQTPVAALANIVNGDQIELRAMVASLDGSDTVWKSALGNIEAPEEIGCALADEFLNSPAAALLEDARQSGGAINMGAGG